MGSDCPFFINNEPAIASGRGEKLASIDLKLEGKYLAIHNPGIHISTREAYAGVSPAKPENTVKSILQSSMRGWKELLTNDFEESIFPNHSGIAKLKSEMYEAGAIYASMTGSGSTVFGIFDERVQYSDWKVLKL